MNDTIAQDILNGEISRQNEEMELIASENYVSADVRTALGSVLTNKYSEGYPGKRYYAWQTYTDQAESLAIERAKKLFGAQFANVQPLSGAPANFAVYLALLKPGEKLLGMALSAGGHLTHGSVASATSKLWQSVSYGVDPETGLIDYDALRSIVLKEKPSIIIAGFSAYPRIVDWVKIKSIADEIGAKTMADIAHIAGIVAVGKTMNPLTAGFDIVTSTTHKTLRGPRGGLILTNNAELASKIDKAVFPWFQGGPHMNSILAKAIAFGEALSPSYADYIDRVLENAKTLAETFKNKNVRVITGGTENHIVLIDVFGSFGIAGREAQTLLEKVGLSTNANTIPGETRTPFDPSGLRLGSPAMTTRGLGVKEFQQIGNWIVEILSQPNNASVHNRIHEEVKAVCVRHPVP